MARRNRAGFTLVELLVVITIIGMLMSLLLPAVNAVRESARRTQCAVNMDQIALAMHNYVTAKSTFPGYRGNKVPDSNPNNDSNFDASWFVAAAPQMEQATIYDRYDLFTYQYPPPSGRYNFPMIELAICPSDPVEGTTQTATGVPVSHLAYVVNAGRADHSQRPSNETSVDRSQNGVFFDRRPLNHVGAAPRIGLEMKDGATNTVMLTENNQAHYWSFQDNSLQVNNLEHHVGFVWQPVNGEPTNPTHKINGNRATNPLGPNTDFARPASNHPGGVNVTFCDRRTIFLREDVEYRVLQQLMTPEGFHALCEVPQTDTQTGRPIPGSNKDYILSAGDYSAR
jgi:prepilin-type N-terminal cleavage/methylation domain-containing protein